MIETAGATVSAGCVGVGIDVGVGVSVGVGVEVGVGGRLVTVQTSRRAMMPKLNGLQVLEKLKADPDTKTIPVVMLTNLAGQQDAETALEKGAVKYIIKSEYEPKQVANMVKEILAGYTRNEVPTTQS